MKNTKKEEQPMKTDKTRVAHLSEYVQGLVNKENGRELYLKYRNDIERVVPQEVFEIFYRQLRSGLAPGEILVFLDKVINVFYKSLMEYSWKKPEKNSFLDYLLQENRALKDRLQEIKEVLKEKTFASGKAELAVQLRQLTEFNSHYLKIENILFPFMEKKAEKFDGLAIMWALHDETRACLKRVTDCLEAPACTETEFNEALGSLFFAMYGLVQKEELILFPTAGEIMNETEWDEMLKQSLEYEFSYIEGPERAEKSPTGDINGLAEAFGESGGLQFRTETGTLDPEQILMIFNALPVELTFVDENDRVRFFTRPKDRIFPRSPAIIGRDVEKCHPPESVHVVREILDGFKSGKHDNAAFWINVKDRMVLIQYFALRDAKGRYRGTLEVSQDITGIKGLEGERRLLQWGK